MIRRLTHRFALLLLPALGLLELVLHVGFARRAPTADDYAALVEPVRDARRDGDLVVVSPGWAAPWVRQALGDEAMPLRDIARPDLEGYGHAVEVSLFGARDPELHARFTEVEARDVGPFTLRLLDQPAAKPSVYDFVDALGPEAAAVRLADRTCMWTTRAKVAAGGLGGHPTWPAARFDCPGSPFFNVSVTAIADERFVARRCIWAHPPQRGVLSIRYRDVPKGTELVGHGGIYWMVERERKGAPVEVEVAVDGQTIGRYIHNDGDGWSPFAMPIGGADLGDTVDVTFSVSSPDHRHRHFCFEARMR